VPNNEIYRCSNLYGRGVELMLCKSQGHKSGFHSAVVVNLTFTRVKTGMRMLHSLLMFSCKAMTLV
jgi:hypothetical protein